jgi:hypothetical protein
MADNVAITAGAGTTVATEDEGGVHYQKVKLTASGTGTTADLSKAEDSIAASGDHGIMALAVRADTPAATGADGDYVPLLTDANGRLHANAVIASGTLTTVSTVTAVSNITNALPAGTNAIGKLAANSGVDIGDVDVTSVIPGVGATNLGKAEDAAHASGDTGVMALAVRSATAPIDSALHSRWCSPHC